jgi:predicted 3-demethylubiquinone-9 3-methyltransferase (glyoxalase superfamily)
MRSIQRITPFLWFDAQAEENVNFTLIRVISGGK